MIQPSSFLNNYTEEAFKDFRTRVLLDSGFFESEEGSKPNFAYNLSTLTTNLDSDTQEFLKATGIKDNTTISHINNYVVKLKRFGLWSKMKALYPFVSDNRNLASYTESAIGVSTGSNAVLSTTEPSPTGSLNAVRVNNAGGNPYNFQNFTLAQNTQYTFSVYVRAVTGTVNFGMYINHSNGGLNLPITYFTATTTWQRFNITFNTATFPNNWYTVINFMTGNIEFWGWQLEIGSTPTAYQPVLGLSSTVYSNHFKYNLKDPRDLDAAFRLTFSGGWQFSQLGATPNGTNGYADTKLIPNTSLLLDSIHGSSYSRTNGAQLGPLFSSESAGSYNNGFYIWPNYGSGTISVRVNDDTSTGGTNSSTLGFHLANRTSSSIKKYLRNDVSIVNTTVTSTGLNTSSIYLAASRNNANFTNYEQAFASFGEGLTDSEATNLYYLTEELQANLKRNVSPYNSFRGILDEYPGAAAAYSLRRLSGSYGGPLVKVRRSSDNTEQDIFPTASGSLDTTSLLSFVGANNGFVTTWYDQSGGLNHLLQSDANKQPSVVTSGVVNTYGNRPNVTFDGVNDTMEKAFTITGTLNLIMLNRRTGVGTDGGTQFVTLFDGPLALNNSANVGYKNIASPTGIGLYPMNWNNDGDTLLFPQLSTLSPFVYSFLIPDTTGKTGYQFINNKTYSTTYTFTPSPANPVNLGGVRLYTGDSGGEAGKGECYEVILYNFDNSNANINIVDRINAYYNIYWDGSRKGLLDFYPNAAAAYSVRALSSSYRGPLIKVRRASDNTERDIFALQNGNLDTFTLATFCSGTNGFVATWYDQSGLGKNATQSTAGSQPQIVSSGTVITENGKPSVSFNGTTPTYLIHPWSTGSGGATVFDVFSTSDSQWILHGNGSLYFPIAEASGGVASDNANITQWYKNGVSQTITGRASVSSVYATGVNLLASYLLTANLSSQTNIALGNLGNFNSNYGFTGKIQESIWYPSNQMTNRNAIEANINSNYTIY
jgi:hypothetical protein